MSEMIEKSKNYLGFWIYIMTDCVVFGTLFATYIVLRNNTDGGVGASDIFDLPFVLTETLILLTSSFTCGLALIAAHKGNKKHALTFLFATALLGLSFLGMEIKEFSHLISEGHDWQGSAFLSSYFTLVGTHGLHITVGLLWMFIMMQQIYTRGLENNTLRRVSLLSLFWHFLDIVWIFIFSIVYLLGVSGI